MADIDLEMKDLRRFRDEVLSGHLIIHRSGIDVTKELGQQIENDIKYIEAVLRRLKGSADA